MNRIFFHGDESAGHKGVPYDGHYFAIESMYSLLYMIKYTHKKDPIML